MIGESGGWVAVMEESWDGTATLHLVNRQQGAVREIIGFQETGLPIWEYVEEGTRGTFAGFRIPLDALKGIAEVLKPGPSQGEVQRLEESLGVERARVDQVLAERLRP